MLIIWADSTHTGMPDVEVALALIGLGPEACAASATDFHNETAMMMAIDRRLGAVVLALAAYGPDASAASTTDNFGNTALMKAISQRMVGVALTLVGLGPASAACATSATHASEESRKRAFGTAPKDTPLILAIRGGVTAVAVALAKLGPVHCTERAVSRRRSTHRKLKPGDDSGAGASEVEYVTAVTLARDGELEPVLRAMEASGFDMTPLAQCRTACSLGSLGRD